MFQFSGLALFRVIYLQYIRLSHSEIFGLMFVCNYPKLIAAYHVLHRLLVPRHPPYALIRFKCYDLIFIRVNVHQDFCFPYYFINTLRCDKKLLSQYVKELETRRFAVMSADSNRLMCTDCYIYFVITSVASLTSTLPI